jgi:hypothetical protein
MKTKYVVQLNIMLSLLLAGFFFLNNNYNPFVFYGSDQIPYPTDIQSPHVLLLDPQTLAANKQKVEWDDPSIMPAYNNLILQADALLQNTPPSVMDKNENPPSGNKHDYLSLAPYSWPDPTKPNGFPYLQKDGETNPERYTIADYQNMQNMINWSQTLALAYYFSDDSKYATKSAELITAWFLNPKTKMNPNLNFAQEIKGKSDGTAPGIIDTNNLPIVLDAIVLLNSSGVFSDDERNGLNLWFTNYLHWLQTSKLGIAESKAKSNHGTWYTVQEATISMYLGNTDQAKRILESSKNLIDIQIDADGKQPIELARTKSWDYSVFNLQGLCDLASLGDKVGINLWNYQNPKGGSIQIAINFLIPYALQEKNWEYKQIQPLNTHTFIVPLKQAADGVRLINYSTFAQRLEDKYPKSYKNDLIFGISNSKF